MLHVAISTARMLETGTEVTSLMNQASMVKISTVYSSTHLPVQPIDYLIT